MPDVGFAGGGKMDTYLRQIVSRVDVPKEVRVGFLENATYPDGTSVPMVAAIQEFGAPSRGIPPRPFFRQMIAAHKDEWGAELGRTLLAKDYNAAAALGSMGEVISGELRQSIVDFSGVPLAPETIARKGSSKPLVDTGHMFQSIGHEVTG